MPGTINPPGFPGKAALAHAPLQRWEGLLTCAVALNPNPFLPAASRFFLMKIKRIDILGFKSFVDKVSLDFQSGITAVLGPNGCGKSNIVDAIRWAMGEQNAKNLRGRSMEDVIFGGSESRRPLGMAEVSMIFANEDGIGPPAYRDYAEIMITRRLYRNGDSEYLINKTPCRLLDISELFMDTGIGARAYSIIEQGKIGMILNSKPEDRRYLIEEAAGVTKYKSRKKSALRKIDATRQNLLRLGDIVSEVRRQLGSLKRQAQKAERFRECREELRALESRFARERYAELQEDILARGEKERAQSQLQEGAATELAQGELLLEELRLRQVTAEREVASGQEKVFHLTAELQRVEGQIGFGAKEQESHQRQQQRTLDEAAEVARRLEEADREEEALQQSGTSLGSDLELEQGRLSADEAELAELAEAERDTATELEEARRNLFTLLTDLSRLGNQHEDARRRLLSLEERAGRNRKEAVSLREHQEQAQEMMGELDLVLRGFRDRKTAMLEEQTETREQLQILRRQIEENESALLQRREELGRNRSRLESLQELERNLEGYGGGVKNLLRAPGLAEQFRGLAADLMEVPADWEIAVEAVLGERLQALRVDSLQPAREGLALLREQGGRGTFLLPLAATVNSVAFAEGLSLSSQVRPRPEAETAVAALLAGVYLVEDLAPYYGSCLPAGLLLVNAAGETLSWRGELSGGRSEGGGSGLLHKKREIKELTGEVATQTATVDALQQQRLQLREDLQLAEETLREIGAALHRKELKLFDNEKDLSRLRQEAERLIERLEVLSMEEDLLHEERNELDGQLQDSAAGCSAKEQEKLALEERVARLQEELQVRRRAQESVRDRVTALKVRVASLREREEGSRRNLERLGRLRTELRGQTHLLASRREESAQDQLRLRQEAERLEVELGLLLRKRDEEQGRFQQLRERFDAGSEMVASQEETLKVLRQRLNQSRESLAALQLKIRELELEAEHLRQAILDRYRLDLADPAPLEEPSLDAELARRRVEELRDIIEGIGEVNLTAIEEYRELEERSIFLTTQQDDLRKSLEGLQTAITKINRTTRKRFRETFDLVNAKFQEVFPRLFRGGKAELQLTDSEDLLETGIEIVVQPPGKRLQSVNLLSGGEKALTAVALIFAIFLIKPSPFCMLDEVDAPLDDANIGRFSDMVREMSAISQFIIITHSKRTMEIADTLYGVTMEEPGVSKLVSVRMHDLQGSHVV